MASNDMTQSAKVRVELRSAELRTPTPFTVCLQATVNRCHHFFTHGSIFTEVAERPLNWLSGWIVKMYCGLCFFCFFVKCVLRIPCDTKPISFLAVNLKFKKKKSSASWFNVKLELQSRIIFSLPDAAFPAVGKPERISESSLVNLFAFLSADSYGHLSLPVWFSRGQQQLRSLHLC